MPDQANVRSTDAIHAVRAALRGFVDQSDQGLVEIDAEVRRLLDYLQHDRPAYWKAQVRLAEDGLHTAKMELQRALMFPVGVEERPACTEQRAALAKAEARLAHCREKQERLRHWVRELHAETHDYRGRVAKFRGLLDTEAPAAVGVLDRLARAVERYAGSSTTPGTNPASTSEPAGASEPTREDSAADDLAADDSAGGVSAGNEEPKPD